jgi:D-alanyl-D-alanine carboxypeptidase
MRTIRKLPAVVLTVFLAGGVQVLQAQSAPPSDADVASFSATLESSLQATLDSLHAASNAPGVTAGVVLADGTVIGLAAGMSDTTAHIAMTPDSRLMQGSVGKTYVSAVAMQLIGEGLLDPEAMVSDYLGDEAWFARMPNADAITVRHLMTHTSGIIRYEFDDQFIADLLASPARVWEPEELLSYLFDTEAPFAAGEGWDYSDTNYILVGLIIEKLTGGTYYEELERRILVPLAYTNTVPTDSRRVPGLVQGYAGVENLFGLPDAVIVDGEFAINPQFEWTGGGIASTSTDLARWGKDLYEGRAFDESLLPLLLDGVPARLGPNVQYGLGVIIRETRLGPAWGHSGFFPGYLTEMYYFPEHGFSVAVQINSSDFDNIRVSPGRMLAALAAEVVAAEAEVAAEADAAPEMAPDAAADGP